MAGISSIATRREQFGLLPGVETAGLKSAAAHAAKTKAFIQKCPDISFLCNKLSRKKSVATEIIAG